MAERKSTKQRSTKHHTENQQFNGQKKKDKNVLQNTTHKHKGRATRTPLKTGTSKHLRTSERTTCITIEIFSIQP